MCVHTKDSGHDGTPVAPYIARFICASHVGLCIFSRELLLCFCCVVTHIVLAAMLCLASPTETSPIGGRLFFGRGLLARDTFGER